MDIEEITQEQIKKVVESVYFFRNLQLLIIKMEQSRWELEPKLFKRSAYDSLNDRGMITAKILRNEYANVLTKTSTLSTRERQFVQKVGNYVFFKTIRNERSYFKKS